MGPGRRTVARERNTTLDGPSATLRIVSSVRGRRSHSVQSDPERDWVATLIAVQEGRFPIPLLDDAGIRELLRSRPRIAMVGASSRAYRPSHGVHGVAAGSGLRRRPVNPREQSVLGRRCYPTVADAVQETGPVALVDVFRRSDQCVEHAREAVAVGARCLWLQLGIANAEAARIAHEAGLDVVMDRCTIVEHRRLVAARETGTGASRDRPDPGHADQGRCGRGIATRLAGRRDRRRGRRRGAAPDGLWERRRVRGSRRRRGACRRVRAPVARRRGGRSCAIETARDARPAVDLRLPRGCRRQHAGRRPGPGRQPRVARGVDPPDRPRRGVRHAAGAGAGPSRSPTLAIREARPCAHCRQVLAEMAWADELRIVDPLGHDLALRDLYPWPFVPADLGEAGARPGASAWPRPLLRLDGSSPSDVPAALLRAGARSHAPYTRDAGGGRAPAGRRPTRRQAPCSRASRSTRRSGRSRTRWSRSRRWGQGMPRCARRGLPWCATLESITIGPTRDLLAAVAPDGHAARHILVLTARSPRPTVAAARLEETHQMPDPSHRGVRRLRPRRPPPRRPEPRDADRRPLRRRPRGIPARLVAPRAAGLHGHASTASRCRSRRR